MNQFMPVIGLEVHIELATKSKMFCACSADYFGAKPNTHVCPICLGLPGAMPKANKLAIEFAQRFALALNCQVQLGSKFDRKNYFYPDLAKGFQISQYDLPFSQKGFLEILSGEKVKKINITRAHLEEDTGKLNHATISGRRVTLIDFNRSGVPLMEVVSEPEMNNAQEAKAYAQKLQQIVRYLKISDADMEKGSMRIEPNVSLRKVFFGSKDPKVTKVLPPYKVELKNINSFKFAEKAINFEIERQRKILESGETPVQETRGWDEKNNRTVSQRSKELAHDYRYFPEPDLTPFTFTQDYINQLARQLPELPDAKIARFQKEFQLSAYDVEILTRSVDIANYFEEAVKAGKRHQLTPKQIANTLINQKIDIDEVFPAKLVQNIITQTQKTQLDPKELEKIVKKVLLQNLKAVNDYKKGKEVALGFLVGQVQRELKEEGGPRQVKEMILRKLKP
ncbi:hypothetical protein A3B52_03315 [Candidatus Curtissbacteria bacterium RIFCSPLOWO2_01_FULL_41_28]|uniref:Aspartyl/glutamyl-tRNA(Asn/Gln) amidotransferase subunit B n=1 Tax=Candidatus Curtissbacteria bacterium RIFOXYA1_FULL_41_14 TaxID=1797737 RepID=A0A1F5HFA9_9BACT|nr:MAG: Aspartyl/glutamyl-tRNA(Asn/Gln) amidotransferase subunit B [Candidatus Curtissbacteria bacterium GW2011_GWD1_40_8]OGD79482.1 MAG: hypothetical protein A2683_02750 [Candidatus Curtissbacteria bacterium RIFCSPHIGHO2_01_FULL_34_40]OGD92975.1 MAG: hypothetical protein A3E14_02730 [Candidatus Curtissbacteria bacterium RIFCSPHIGHO2_12_FULL_41_13]OGD96088.1 MAG: hypothetical protein A3B52_03315 [Candidatus Curtissbacteria bacterium RIFCSPLOWO2_01_FULL_41_28]OGE02808.1 MAG: hypothetical protein